MSDTGIQLNELQDKAVVAATDSTAKDTASIVTGGPGVGKTFTAQVIVSRFKEKGRNVALCAPTGRAAKRLNEVTGFPASTIHRLLKPMVKDGVFFFSKNRGDPLEHNVIVIDEASMVDVPLMASLCRAVKRNTQMCIIGDVDQLPSVGPGSVLSDLISCGKIPATRLTEVVRQKAGSSIVTNAHRINSGTMPVRPTLGIGEDSSLHDVFAFCDRTAPGDKLPDGKDFDFAILKEGEDEKVATLTVEIAKRFGAQIIVPMHKPLVGTKELNKRMQASMNPLKGGMHPIDYGPVQFREGDRVMNTKNDYERGIFNGDMGWIKKIDPTGSGRIVVDFQVVTDDNKDDFLEAAFSRSDLIQLTHAWAISIHKSQGCEWEHVIIPLHRSHHIMLQRNLIYTAVTRAKKFCWLIGSDSAISTAVRTNVANKRETLLRSLMNVVER